MKGSRARTPAAEPKRDQRSGRPPKDKSFIATGGRRIPRQFEIPITKKVSSQSQCAPVTITEIESIPNSNSSASIGSSGNNGIVKCRPSSQFQVSSTRLVDYNNGPASLALEHFTDTESVFSTSTNGEMTMIVPRNIENYTVMSSENYGRRSKDTKDTSNESLVESPIVQTLFKSLLQYAMDRCTWKLAPYILVGVFVMYFLFPTTSILTFLAFCYVAFKYFGGGSVLRKKISKRTVKWTIEEFSEEIRNGFLTCPPFNDKSGQWRLVISQKLLLDGVHTSLGLIATNIPKDVAYVTANIKFSCSNSCDVELAPGMNRIKLQHRFERCGDLGLTKPVMFSNRLHGDDVIKIGCRVEFESVAIGYWSLILRMIGVIPPQRSNNVREVGVMQQEILVYKDSPTSKMELLTCFVQHPDTKTFAWEIPNFAMILKSKDVWGVYSPQFFVNTEDFCAVWRMKLIEVSGVFRVHVQLRGLPRTLQQVRLWYLLQLVDHFGDSIVPEHSMSRVTYPDHLNLWDTSRHILYRRETLLSRFIHGIEGSLTIRLSLQVKPNDLPLLEADSDEWLSPN